MADDLPGRIDSLEVRIAHQDAIIEDLNGAIMAQWTTIEALQRRLAALDAHLQDVEARAALPPSVPPPHS